MVKTTNQVLLVWHSKSLAETNGALFFLDARMDCKRWLDIAKFRGDGHIVQIILNLYLVGGLEHFTFFHILGTIFPFDIFFRGVETTNQIPYKPKLIL